MKLSFVTRLLGKCIPKGLLNDSKLALASLAESLFGWRNHFVDDVGRYKEAGLRCHEAKATIKEAEARKKMAEAADAANKVTERESAKAMFALQLEQKAIRNRKMAADADAAQAKAAKAQLDVAVAQAKVVSKPQVVVVIAKQVGQKEKAEAPTDKIPTIESFIEVYQEARRNKIKEAEDEAERAIKQYLDEGGIIYVDPHNLKKLMKLNAEDASADDECDTPPNS